MSRYRVTGRFLVIILLALVFLILPLSSTGVSATAGRYHTLSAPVSTSTPANQRSPLWPDNVVGLNPYARAFARLSTDLEQAASLHLTSGNKIDSVLLNYIPGQQTTTVDHLEFSATRFSRDTRLLKEATTGKLTVIAEVQPGTEETAVATLITIPGVRVVGYSTELHMVQLTTGGLEIPLIAALDLVNYVRLPWKPDLQTVTRTVTNEALSSLNVPNWQGSGQSGTGMKVAIIDDGFAGYEALLGNQLPANVTVKSFTSDSDITGGGVVHGTACAELVHSVAPGAQLYLVNFDTEVSFARSIDYVIGQGVKVVTHSIGWLATGPLDGTNPIDRLVEKAHKAGILWINSMGNSAERHWRGQYNDPAGKGFNQFAPGSYGNPISVHQGQPIRLILDWDDWYNSDQDYNMALVRSDGTILATSTNVQNGSQPPREMIFGTAAEDAIWYIVIVKKHATRAVTFHLYSSTTSLYYSTPGYSLSAPADSDNVLSIGADYYADNHLESFSSQGPTDDGRVKPDLLAPDGISTNTYGSADGAGDEKHGFYGTSASAPISAGTAALVWGANPTYSNDMVTSYLEQTAAHIGNPGKNTQSGNGLLHLPDPHNPPLIPDPAFYRTWEHSDIPVASGHAARGWTWGPQPFALQKEPYADSPGGQRLVEYWDKTRMEINNPAGDATSYYYVTNGLLAKEMISGNFQTGNSSFQQSIPAGQPVAGDASGNSDAPTYASFHNVSTLASNNYAADRTGATAISSITRNGVTADDAHYASYGVKYAYYEPTLQHNVADVFWNFMNQQGLLYVNNVYINDNIYNWRSVMGFPLAEPYWSQARVGGVQRDVLIQVFERRVLTYTPSNDRSWRVEMGNVGQHYYNWRYNGGPVSTPVPTFTPGPGNTPTPVPTLTVGPNTPTPTVAPTNTPLSTATIQPTSTGTPLPTTTPIPTSTSTPLPTNTATVISTSTSTPTPTPGPTTLTVTPSAGPAGTTFQFNGSGYGSDEKVNVNVYDPSGSLYATYSLNSSGLGTIDFTIATPTKNIFLGVWTVRAKGSVSGKSARTTFTLQ